jgi:hypothetical protein
MSIVRIGLSETDKFSEGYDAIFGKKKKNRSTKQATKNSKPSRPKASKKTKKK